MTGEELYNAFSTAMNEAHKRRAHYSSRYSWPTRQGRWKDQKPWVKGVWDKAAELLNEKEKDESGKD